MTLAAPRRWTVPLVRPDLPNFAELGPGIERIVASGMLTKGSVLDAFEADMRSVTGCRHAIAVSSCTVGLALVLRSLAAVADRRHGGCHEMCHEGCATPAARGRTRAEVIVPSFIFLAAPAAIVWAGLEPVFVEVDPATYTVDPAAVERAITDRTAAILACHTFGCPCDMAALRAISARTGVPLVVDAAHGLGTLDGGRQVGAGGLAQVFSLSPTKLVVAGEGGVVVTSCDCLADLVRKGREYGNDGHYGCSLPGLNGRMPEISAHLARASLARLNEVAARRAAAVAAYRRELTGLPGITLQAIPATGRSSWKDFTIAVDPAGPLDRQALHDALAAKGIETRAYYSPCCHRMESFAGYVRPEWSLPITERLADTVLALPLGVHVTPDVARQVAGEIRAAVASHAVAGR